MGKLLTCALLMVACARAHATFEEGSLQERTANAVVQVLLDQPDSIEEWKGDKVYVLPERIRITKSGAFLCRACSCVQIPSFAIDNRGVFLLCSKKEAQEHYDRAWEALKDAVGHSVGAGAALVAEQPLIGVFEGYRAVEKWKEFGREYNAYHSAADLDRTGTIDSSRDSKD